MKNLLHINASEGTGSLQLAFTLFEATQWNPENFRFLRIDHFPVSHNVFAENVTVLYSRLRWVCSIRHFNHLLSFWFKLNRLSLSRVQVDNNRTERGKRADK
jgi:hypothetical protein